MGHRTKSDYFLLQLDLFVFITEMEHIYCTVRTESLNIIQIKYLSWELALDLFVFITEMDRVYCVVRTESLNIMHNKFLS